MKGEVQLEPSGERNPSDSDPLLVNHEVNSSAGSSEEIKDEHIEAGSVPCRRICLESDGEPGMSKIQLLFQWLLFTIFVAELLYSSHGDVGTSSQYSPPYIPTVCYGNDPTQFPSSNLFAAAGDGIWDNGAACGRQYLVRCISASQPGICVPDQTIQIKIVDYALQGASPPLVSGTTLVLSETAFATIANSSARSINIEFQQV